MDFFHTKTRKLMVKMNLLQRVLLKVFSKKFNELEISLALANEKNARLIQKLAHEKEKVSALEREIETKQKVIENYKKEVL